MKVLLVFSHLITCFTLFNSLIMHWVLLSTDQILAPLLNFVDEGSFQYDVYFWHFQSQNSRIFVFFYWINHIKISDSFNILCSIVNVLTHSWSSEIIVFLVNLDHNKIAIFAVNFLDVQCSRRNNICLHFAASFVAGPVKSTVHDDFVLIKTFYCFDKSSLYIINSFLSFSVCLMTRLYLSKLIVYF
jgi:hypothetical protein